MTTSDKLLFDIPGELSKAIQYHHSGQLDQAETIYLKILEIQPNHPETLHLMGVCAHQTGRNEMAVNLIGKAIQISPKNPHYHSNLGAALRDQGKTDPAISCYQKALQLQPNYAEAHNNMGNALREQGHLDKAVAAYQNAIRLKPDFLSAYNNLGVTLKDQGKVDKAIACYQQAVQVKPDYVEAYNKMGNTFRDQGKTDQAAAAYHKALQIRPNPGIEVKKALLVPPINVSKTQIEESRKKLIQELECLKEKQLRLEDPHSQVGTTNFYLAYHGLNDREIQKQIAEFYIRACPELESGKWEVGSGKWEVRETGSRAGVPIRIGFVSIHLYHPTQQTVGKLTRGIVRHLSREKFQVTLFCFSGTKNDLAETFEADEIVVLPNNLAQAREKLAAHQLDILFYPDIGMDPLTYFLAFSRLAPVQCVTWGHPVTTGIPNMDYFISSESLEPPGAEDHYSERLIRLKRLPAYYDRPKPPEHVFPRERFGLPRDCHLYVCPQALFKFHPDFDAAIAAILRSDPRGLLVLLEGSYKHFTQQIWDRFCHALPDVVNRVRFVSFMPHDAFLSLLMLADALIDPPYFGGGNTSYESFALGRPIVTWPGPFMRGRVTLACCKQMNIMDCVANDAQSYVSLALRLANDIPWRNQIRDKIKAASDALFEDIQAVRELEHFFDNAISQPKPCSNFPPHPSPLAPRPLPLPRPPSPLDIPNALKQAMRHHESGQTAQAEAIYQNILEMDPNHADALHLSGVIAHQTGRKAIAVNLIRKAIQTGTEKACYHNSLGITFQDQGQTNQAIACYEKALEIRPDFVEAYSNMGFALQDQGRLDQAIACYQKALEIRPNDAVAYNDMGTALQDQGRTDEAVACYQKALEIRPNYPEAHNNLGNAFKDQNKLDESIISYRNALTLNPDYTKAYTYLIHQLQQTCAWKEIRELSPKLDALTQKELEQGEKTSESPFMNLSRCTDLSRNLAVAKSWADDAAKPMRHLNLCFPFDDRREQAKNQGTGQRKITVGYLSSDFRNHAVSHLMLGVFGLHDRNVFNVFCYSYGQDDGSHYRRRIQADCDQFVDIRGHSHEDAARRIYEDQVDILVELTGHTKDGRFGLCALRPAPIQVIYLGFPGTSGADFMDYIITDKIVTPEHHAAYYSESFAYMPHCFQINDNTQPISDKHWEKSDFGLPEDAFVFCSFNHGYKIEPVMFDVWMRILQKVPKGILWMPSKSEMGERNLRQEAQARRVAPERLLFAEKLPTKGDYLARIRLADLALDTRIYNGHTTTSDALWAGVPVITLQGDHYASRVASSVLTAVGLPELVAYRLEDYEQLAVRLANTPGELGKIRMKLAKNRLKEPLFDTPRFVRNLEKAYEEMWEIFLAGQHPRQIEVKES